MADLLTQGRACSTPTTPRPDWWPVDKVILAYFAGAVVLELIFWSRLPDPRLLLAAHMAGALLLTLAVYYPGNAPARIFHYWYPLAYVFYCYKEMSILIPARRATTADAALPRLDFAICGANPTVWLERFRSPLLAEALKLSTPASSPAS